MSGIEEMKFQIFQKIGIPFQQKPSLITDNQIFKSLYDFSIPTEIKKKKTKKDTLNLYELKQIYDDVRINQEQTALKKEKLNNILWLNNNFFIRGIETNYFRKHYMDLFEIIEYKNDDIIFNENDEIKYIYLIKEGEVECKIIKSILQIQSFIEYLNNINGKDVEQSFDIPFTIDEEGNKIYSSQYYKQNCFRIFIKGEGQVLGVKEYNFRIPHLFQAKVNSEKAIIFRISLENLKCFFSKERMSKTCFIELSNNLLTTFIIRLLNLKKGFIKIIDRKLSISDPHNLIINTPRSNSNINIGFSGSKTNRNFIVRKGDNCSLIRQFKKSEFDLTKQEGKTQNIFSPIKKNWGNPENNQLKRVVSQTRNSLNFQKIRNLCNNNLNSFTNDQSTKNSDVDYNRITLKGIISPRSKQIKKLNKINIDLFRGGKVNCEKFSFKKLVLIRKNKNIDKGNIITKI